MYARVVRVVALMIVIAGLTPATGGGADAATTLPAAVGGRFVTTWDTASDTTVELPLYGAVDVLLDWGDGSGQRVTGNRSPDTTGPVIHVFTDGSPTHQVTATGVFARFGSSWTTPHGLVSVDEWGPTATTDLSYAFYASKDVERVAEIPPGVTDTSYMFQFSSFNGSIGGWDVSSVTDMTGMFSESAFNQPIGGWDVSHVTSMSNMFSASVFDQPIGNWDVSSVTDLSYLFLYSVFDQPLSDWDVSSATNMSGTFQNSVFNQPIGGWDVSNVTNMTTTFAASLFDQPIGTWDVSHVRDMGGMFRESAFDQPIGEWNVTGVTRAEDMHAMFSSARSFNRDLSAWCVPTIRTEPTLFDLNASAWTRPRPIWGTCPGDSGPDTAVPAGAFGTVTGTDGVLRLRGTAWDNRGVRAVAVAIRNPDTGKWLRRDGTWGAYQKLYSALTDAGTTLTEWRLHRVLPAGRYGVSLFVVDTSGNRNLQPRPWLRATVS